jgi:zinc protease
MIKSKILGALLFQLIALFVLETASAQTPESLHFDPLRFEPPEPRTSVLSNGIPVYLLEDHELPLVKVDVLVTQGTLHEPPEQVGLFEIMADVMRTGGTASRSPAEVDEELESMAASVELSLGREYGIAALDLLAEDLQQGLEIFADILRHPLFQDDRVDLRKQQAVEAIRRRNDTPSGIAFRLFPSFLYGKSHPMGSYEEIPGIESITRDDLKRAHTTLFHPGNLLIAASGDFEPDRILTLLEQHLGNWEPCETAVKGPLPEPEIYRGRPMVIYVEKDLNQSTLVVGYTSLKRTPDNGDIFALRVMNEILGESPFTSRLFREVRDKRGLAYSVSSYFDTSSYTFPGYWVAFAQTRAEKTVETASIMIDVIGSMKAQPVSDGELELIKDYIINSFVFGFESSSGIVRQRMILDARGYPEDYLENYTDNIARVTSSDVLNVARRYVNLDHLIIVVVGNEKYFEEPLEKLGVVVRMDPSEL